MNAQGFDVVYVSAPCLVLFVRSCVASIVFNNSGVQAMLVRMQ